MKKLIPVIFLMFATALTAQEFPASFYVSNVDANDTLNIRSEPSSNAEIIGEFGPYRLNIEVLETNADATWARVGYGEGMGWVSMAYLSPAQTPEAGTIPRPLRCFGTEPFWSIDFFPRGEEFSTPEQQSRLTLTRELTSDSGYLAQFGQDSESERMLIIKRSACNDGMSDRDFGFTATLFSALNGQNAVHSGCCTLDSGD